MRNKCASSELLYSPSSRSVFRTDEVMAGELGIAVAVDFINGARDFTAFDVGRADVVGGADKGAGQCLHPVAVDHNKVRFLFAQEVRKTGDGFGQYDRWSAIILVHRAVISGVDLVRVMTAAVELAAASVG